MQWIPGHSSQKKIPITWYRFQAKYMWLKSLNFQYFVKADLENIMHLSRIHEFGSHGRPRVAEALCSKPSNA